MDSTPGPNATAADYLVTRLIAAWNASDSATRDHHLRAAWSEAGRFIDPLTDLEGREALAAHIAEWKAREPDKHLVVVGEVAIHHGQCHFTWAVLDGNGRETLAGCCVAEFDSRHQIRQMASFFSPATAGTRPIIALALATRPRT